MLPLRGWAGDVMATQMASAAIAVESGAASAHKANASASPNHSNQATPDCHEALENPADSDNVQGSAADSDHCGTCQACQACHTVALLPAMLEIMTSKNVPQLRPMRSAYTSAAAALGQKPPIS